MINQLLTLIEIDVTLHRMHSCHRRSMKSKIPRNSSSSEPCEQEMNLTVWSVYGKSECSKTEEDEPMWVNSNQWRFDDYSKTGATRFVQ